MLTEYINPNQLVAINEEVIVNMIIFFDDLNNAKKLLISLKSYPSFRIFQILEYFKCSNVHMFKCMV